MSLVPEQWTEVARGEEDGIPTVIVAREKDYAPVPRLTTWKLQFMRGDWRVRQVFFSQPNLGLDRKPNRLKDYPSGIRLTDSAIDRRLRGFTSSLAA